MITPNLRTLFDTFQQYGYELRIVGGAVRDFILSLEPKDIDLCTNAVPDEMIRIAKEQDLRIIPTGLQHGTVTFVINDEQFEVTTLRVDRETDGRHATVEYTTSFEVDAARRDISINAMSMDVNGNLYDYFGGREDLQNYRVRFVGDADTRVKEDYLRILRYFRFIARFGNIEDCLDEIKVICSKDNLEGLKTISVERYWLEMQKLVRYLYAKDVLDCMHYHGVLKVLGLAKPSRNLIVSSTDYSIANLSTMLDSSSIDDFLNTWKLSSDESKQLRWLIDNRYTNESWQELLVDGVPRQWVIGKYMLCNDIWTAREIKVWEIPVFPVTGQDLLDAGMTPGKELGAMLKTMRQEWKDSGFTATKEDLLF